MKLHDLRPAEGSRTPRTRVGRGIAAGKGKTAGRGTKGQNARAGGGVQPWFEGGQTPLHIRIPKLRGFRNRFRIEYEVVNVGRLAALADLGVLSPGELPGAPKGSAPVTITQEILRAAGLVSTLDKPLKVLGHGEVSQALFVVADAFSKSAAAKIEAAGGTAQVIEYPGRERSAEEPAGEPAPVAEATRTPGQEPAADEAASEAGPEGDERAGESGPADPAEDA